LEGRSVDGLADTGEKGKEPTFGGSERSPLMSYTNVNFFVFSGPPVHAILPGVFDRTGGDLHRNGAQFGICLGILGERGPLRARIGEVVKSFENGGFVRRFKGDKRIFSF
jgi:hypothetical protein